VGSVLSNSIGTPYRILDSEENTNDPTTEQVADPILDAILAQVESVDGIDLTTALTKDELSSMARSFIRCIALIVRADLGPQAISFIKNSSDPFNTLTFLSSNFPRLAIPLSRLTPLSGPLIAELRVNALKAAAGSNMFWLNGVYYSENEFTPFSILNKLRSEREIMGQLTQLGLSPKQALEVLSSKHVQKASSQGAVLDGVFDASDRAEGGDVIVWLNDLEKDERYADMQRSLRAVSISNPRSLGFR
jgi:UDP-glucose:glycoprotein glucosyltransferase